MFEELIDEVGIDATRYYMLSRSSEQPIDFDIDVAKKQDASNPVYYDQYAHARICKLLRDASGHTGEDNLDMDAVAAVHSGGCRSERAHRSVPSSPLCAR